jgi:hypothetical protein
MVRSRDNSKLAYRGTTFIAPPPEVWVRDADATFELLLQGFLPNQGEQIAPAQKEFLREIFTFVRCRDLDSRSLVNALDKTPGEQFVFVPDVSLYSKSDTPAAGTTGAALKQEEDLWVPATVATAEHLIDLAKQKACFLFLTSPADPPVRSRNIELISEVESLNFASLRSADEESFRQQLQKMLALAKNGRAAEAFDELDTTPAPALNKLLARIQILHHSGDSKAATTLIPELLKQTTPPPNSVSYLAVICHRGGDFPTAKRLIEDVIDDMSEGRSLSVCLETATAMRDADLVERVWTRLQAVSPQNHGMQYDCEIRLLQICQQDASKVQAERIARIGFTEFHTQVSERFAPDSDVDYQEQLEELRAQWPQHYELAVMCSATHAEVSHKPQMAWELVGQLIPDTRFAPAAAKLVVRTMRELFLEEAVSREDFGVYVEPLKLLVEYLGRHPSDKEIRALVSSTLSVELGGIEGLPLITLVAVEAGRAMSELEEEYEIDAATEEEFQEFEQRWDEWETNQSVLDPRVSLPSHVVGENAAGLARCLLNHIEFGVLKYEQADDLETLRSHACILASLAPHVPGTYDDIKALRLLSAKFAQMNDSQRARDLAELIIEIAGDHPGRRRFAWGSYADIYQRSHDATEAFLALACAGTTSAPQPASHFFHEIYTHLRTLRDIGFHDVAQSQWKRFFKILGDLGMTEVMRNRLEVIGLSLQLSKASRLELASLHTFIEDCQRVLLDAVRMGDELIPAASIFVQALGFYERAGGNLSADAAAAKQQALATIGKTAAANLQLLSVKRPTSAELVDLYNRTANSRYASDAPNDALAATIVAPRLLAAADPEVAVQDACLAIELLADRGLTVGAPPTQLTVDHPIRFAQSLAQQHQVAVLMLAHDSTGELVATLVDAASAEVQRAPASSAPARERLRAWSKTYPFRYGLINPRERLDPNGSSLRTVGDGEFYESMRPFNIPFPQGNRVLVVAEPEVAQLPFNLVLRQGGLIGYDTAIGMVPSLTWLEAARQRTRASCERRVAWISDAGNPSQLDAMTVVKGMLQPHLESHRIVLNTSRDLPQGIAGAQMAIVTAHGQLAQGGKYFRRIVDEGALRESPLALAQALAGVELVILFICSGGRLDRHPGANTTVGLPKMLLERGCRTVIASPWPLESLAAGPWLEGFLGCWEQGATAMDACHEANKKMALRREGEPQFSLAMTVYGDPLLDKP